MSAPKNPESTIEDNLDAEWMPSYIYGLRIYEEPPTPCPWIEYDTTKEIYEQAVFIILARVRTYQSIPRGRPNVLRYEPNSS
jgi:hypothetical protein